jgi:hypothetical protein
MNSPTPQVTSPVVQQLWTAGADYDKGQRQLSPRLCRRRHGARAFFGGYVVQEQELARNDALFVTTLGV